MEVVQAQLQDVDTLAPLFDAYRVFYEQSSDMALAKEFLTQRLTKKDSVIFLCMDGDKALGFSQLYPVFSSVSCKPDYILNDLFVRADSREKGVGKNLLLCAQKFTKEQGFKGLALETQKENHARFLYEKLGWKKATNLHYYWTA
jgi:GNAT superfamily N-acetyltransferase